MTAAFAAESAPDYRREGDPAPSKREAKRALQALGYSGLKSIRLIDEFFAAPDPTEAKWQNYLEFVRLIESAPTERNRSVTRDRRLRTVPA